MHRGIVFEGVPDHQGQAAGLGPVAQRQGIVAGEGEGFLDQDVQAVIQAVAGNIMMGGRRGGHHHGIQIHLKQVKIVWGGLEGRIDALGLRQTVNPQIGHGDHFRTGHFHKVAHQIGAPVAVTDHTDT